MMPAVGPGLSSEPCVHGPPSREKLRELMQALAACDPGTANHCRRVRCHALRLAREMGLPRCQRRLVGLAALLHDMGKMCLPAALLHKTEPLSADEFRLIQQHCVLGEQLLAPLLLPAEVLAAIRTHHERLDGSGYPDGLAGDAIGWLARLVAVADCFDAMTMPRPYRPALAVPQALALLRSEAGKRLDRELVDLLAGLVCQGRLVRLAPSWNE